MHPQGAFPALHAVTRLGVQNKSWKKKGAGRGKILTEDGELHDVVGSDTVHNNSLSCVYDVKFYPYTEPEEDAVFAVVAAREVYVYRPSPNQADPVQVLCVFRDPKEDASLNSVVWSQDPETGDPLLCFGGAGSGAIKIVNVVKEKFVRNLTGHGGAINDLAISPLTPTILASACADYSIRLWNLDPNFASQPCAAILASPDAHKQSVLALGFHSEGKYLLSGGTDTMINLWPVPSIPSGSAVGSDKVDRVYFPVFSSTEIHSDYVDCLRFYGDLVLSHAAATSDHTKASKNSILLWKIDGFSSAAPVPDRPPVAEPGKYTRSAFGGRFQRLLTFDMPNTTPFYMRFSLFEQPGLHPILVMGNERSRFSFWDLYALEAGPEEAAVPIPAVGGRRKKKRGGYRPRRPGGTAKASSSSLSAAATAADNATTTTGGTPSVAGADDSEGDDYETAAEDNDDEDDDDDQGAGGSSGEESSVRAATATPSVSEAARTPSTSAADPTFSSSSLPRPQPKGVARLKPSSAAATPKPGSSSHGRQSSAGGTTGSGSSRRRGGGRSTQQRGRELRFDVSDPFRAVAPHYTVTVPKYNFTVRQVAWSNCGRWCVAVGEVGLVCVFKRWVD